MRLQHSDKIAQLCPGLRAQLRFIEIEENILQLDRCAKSAGVDCRARLFFRCRRFFGLLRWMLWLSWFFRLHRLFCFSRFLRLYRLLWSLISGFSSPCFRMRFRVLLRGKDRQWRERKIVRHLTVTDRIGYVYAV